MLSGLSALELGRLRVSVGYGTHKRGRPLSPVEVGVLIGRAREAGNSLEDCAREIRIDESGIGRFLRLEELPEEVRHLVDWGSGKGVVGFSCATELVRVQDPADQRTVAEAVLENGLNSREVRQVAQLLKRSGRPVQDAVAEVVGMRTVVVQRYVYVGTVTDGHLASDLEKRTQQEKNALLSAGIERLGLHGVTGRLAARRFTLVGDDRLGHLLSNMQEDELEEQLCAILREEVGDAASRD